MNRKVNLLEEINSGILVLEVLAKDYKLSQAELSANIDICKNNILDCNPKFNNNVLKKTFTYHKHMNLLSSKTQMLLLYFENSVVSLIPKLHKAIELNYNAKNVEKKESKNDNKYTKYFNKDFNTIKDLSNARLEILKAMIDDIKKTSDLLYN
ncbi:hypothetical protein [Arcobacter roscoffensis]|uniref:Uncharacterized protein n=1 Tax=Arcobacter roscoffensis TaxID=2961520 RepID=A0ABY5E317_9BACT|nr:hypothetical protein [Arcobacter roscoffensis]UTJ05545.1 hypothetical protein NJU99_09735 [Arcobacter roscoffensis]